MLITGLGLTVRICTWYLPTSITLCVCVCLFSGKNIEINFRFIYFNVRKTTTKKNKFEQIKT